MTIYQGFQPFYRIIEKLRDRKTASITLVKVKKKQNRRLFFSGRRGYRGDALLLAPAAPGVRRSGGREARSTAGQRRLAEAQPPAGEQR